MAKQVFEFTDEETAQALWRDLVSSGKAGEKGVGSISVRKKREGGFAVTLKIDAEATK